ncbi:M14 family zinc carboxypeptidase [Desulfovibrio inopinatus]|uniref:M14 family zinc carboxypeptidase n=1 Tax=Desulfovibrio inopinatus TaxID=102109 RepID=UPI00041261E4|nr:M14 family zinc carboxypeptidase [Desulfovibrio inopinatus]
MRVRNIIFGVILSLVCGVIPARGQDRFVVEVCHENTEAMQQVFERFVPWTVIPAMHCAVFDVSGAERLELEASGYRVRVDLEKTEKYFGSSGIVTRARQKRTISGYSCLRTTDELYAACADLAQRRPDLVLWSDIGDSWEKTQELGGHDIMLLRLGKPAVEGTTAPIVLLTAGIHARELAPPEVAVRFAEYLVSFADSDPEIAWLLATRQIHLIPVVNPDGRAQAQTGLLWRKNTNNTFCAATDNRGVDLNRNFPFNWACCNGSSPFECANDYRGPMSSSEPETTAVTEYIRSIFPDRRGEADYDAAPDDTPGLYIDLHSYGEMVLWPWGYTYNSPPNETLSVLGQALAGQNGYWAGQASGLYPTDGAADDFGYGERGVASYTIEMGTDFFQECPEFEQTIWPSMRKTLLYAFTNGATPYLTPSGPLVEVTSIVNDSAKRQLHITAVAQVSQAGTVVRSASVGLYSLQGVLVSTTVAMQPRDGVFDAAEETVEADMTVDPQLSGTFFVVADAQTDNDITGPQTAAFAAISDPYAAIAAILDVLLENETQ